MESTEIIIVGAGVVGLALARALSQQGHEVLLLESESAIASVTSARNSGVIHAGFYYKPGSLKARLCVEGRQKLYAYCLERGIPHKRCGKIIVATSEEQIPELHKLLTYAKTNGVSGLHLITAEEARTLEPEISCVAALHSPDSGVVDVHNYTMALLGDAEAHGTTLALQSPVIGGSIPSPSTNNLFVLDIGGASPFQISCRTLINAAGLGAQNLARTLRGLNAATIPPQVLAKGNYFSLSGPQPFKMLIYPVPVMGSVGLHACTDMAGRVRFGPDVEWVDHIDYTVDAGRVSLFEESVRRYWPQLPEHALNPDYCGIRPKLAKASHYDTDFMIQTEKDHKVPNLINLYGIESPGLTSSLALADMIADTIS